MKVEEKKSTRVEWIDVLKGVVIILVVLGHNIQYGAGKEFLADKSFFSNLVFKLIYSFHMPCFMMVSGFFFGFTIKKKNILSSRIQSLLIPTIIWSMIPICARLAKQVVECKMSCRLFFSISIRTLLTYFWFLWAVMICSLIVLFLFKLSKDRIQYFIIILIILLFSPDWLNTEYWKYMFPYFIIGYLWNKKDKYIQLNEQHINFSMPFIIICFFILFLFYDDSSYIYTTGIQIDSLHQFVIDLYRYAIGFVGAVMMILIVRKSYVIVDRAIPEINKAMAYLGKISFSIYIIDCIMNDYVIKVVTTSFSLNYLVIIIETIVVIFCCIMIDYGIKSMPLTRRMLLGDR